MIACATATAKLSVSLKLKEILSIPFLPASSFALPFSLTFGGPYHLRTTMSLGLTP